MRSIVISFLVLASVSSAFGQYNSIRLWGVSNSGGATASLYPGSIFSMNPDGSDFQTAKTFGWSLDGNLPLGAPIKSTDGYLYGILRNGGQENFGVIYRLDLDGSNFTKIYDFKLANENVPITSLIEREDGRLYGVTRNNPLYEHVFGTLYSVNKDGSDFKIVYEFPVVPFDVLMCDSDGYFYGAVTAEGSNGQGYIYKVYFDGSGFTNIRSLEYEQTLTDRSLVEGPDGLIYGAFHDKGLFRMQKDGSGLAMTFPFSNITNGITDFGFLVSANKIFGVAQSGGPHNGGVLYSMNLNGSGFTRLIDFEDSDRVGRGLTVGSNEKLYGTYLNGAFYEVDKDGTDLRIIHQLDNGTALSRHGWSYPMVETDANTFIGSAEGTGASLNGIVYKVTTSNDFTLLKEFPEEGRYPTGQLTASSDGYLYGQTSLGGDNGVGTIFKIKQDGTDFSEIYHYTEQSAYARPRFIEHNNMLYGSDGAGIFKIGKDGTNFAYLKKFSLDYNRPIGDIILYNGFIYGLVSNEPFVDGTFYKMDITTGDVTDLYKFGTNEITFVTNLALVNDRFLIVAWYYSNLTHEIFSIKPDGSDITKIYSGQDQAYFGRNVPFLASDGLVYATRFYNGFFYSMNPDGSNFMNYKFSTFSSSVGSIIEPKVGELFFAATHQVVNFNIASKTFTPLDMPRTSTDGVTSVNKLPQTVEMDDISAKTYGDDPFEVSASSSLGREIIFISSNTDVATVDGNVITIVGAGMVTIKAYQQGSITISDASDESTFTVGKATQIITFEEAVFNQDDHTTILSGSSSSNLDLIYSTPGNRVLIVNDVITFLASGRVTIKAEQPGNENYFPAEPVERSFCINPRRPFITITGFDGAPTLVSSNFDGNQWCKDDESITHATLHTYKPSEDGVYKVQTIIDDCLSLFSDEAVITVTGLEDKDHEIKIFPNSSERDVYVYTPQQSNVAVMDINGRTLLRRQVNGGTNEHFNIGSFSSGIYIFRIEMNSSIITKRISKL